MPEGSPTLKELLGARVSYHFRPMIVHWWLSFIAQRAIHELSLIIGARLVYAIVHDVLSGAASAL